MELWRNKAAGLAGFLEKLHAPGPRIALGVAAAARSRSFNAWNLLEQEVCIVLSAELKFCGAKGLPELEGLSHLTVQDN